MTWACSPWLGPERSREFAIRSGSRRIRTEPVGDDSQKALEGCPTIRVGAGFPERLNWAAPGACLPATAPAQHRLAYTAFSFTGKLWRMDLRTGERRIIVDSRYEEYNPQDSPDGRKVAFQSERSGDNEVWTCDADGTNCQQLTFFEEPVGGSLRRRQAPARDRGRRAEPGAQLVP